MLDTIRTLIAKELGTSTAETNKVREELLKEQASADARYAATSALIHPEGSTTPINEAYSRAQGRVATLRTKAAAELPSILALLLALEIATERRDDAKRHRDMKWDEVFAKEDTGVKPEVRDWFARLARHGVHPHYVKQLSEETVAIIADLISWKAKDATFKDPDNPWRAVLGIYAGRIIEVPGRIGKTNRSVAGTPKHPRHKGGQRHYMFNEMVSPLWNVPTPAVPIATPPPADRTRTGIFDCSTGPNEAAVPDGLTTGTSDDATSAEPAVDTTAVDQPDDQKDRGQPTQSAPIVKYDAIVPVPPAQSDPDDSGSINEARAREIAEAVFERNPIKMGIYWPREGVERNDYDPDKLIPSLERWVASGTAWGGAERFLAAARAGRAREFISDARATGVRHLARQLQEGETHALEDARRLGLIA